MARDPRDFERVILAAMTGNRRGKKHLTEAEAIARVRAGAFCELRTRSILNPVRYLIGKFYFVEL